MRRRKCHIIDEAFYTTEPGLPVAPTTGTTSTPPTQPTAAEVLVKQAEDALYCLFESPFEKPGPKSMPTTETDS